MSDEAEIQTLFEHYITMWNARDFDGMSALFTEPTISIGPDGPTVIPDNSALSASLKTRFVRLEKEGFDHTEIETIDVHFANADTATAYLRNIQRLRGDGSAIDELDALYILNRIEGVWKLSVGMAGAPGWRSSDA